MEQESAKIKTGRIFTPRVKRADGVEVRVEMKLSEEDFRKIRRGRGWSADVTDILTGKKYKTRGASCGAPRCFCDAIAKEIV